MIKNDSVFYRGFRKIALPVRLTWKPVGDPETFRDGLLKAEKINNPLLLAKENKVFLYRGSMDGDRAEVMADTQPVDNFDPRKGWKYHGRVTPKSVFNPPDKQLDPAACYAHGKVWLYWSNVGQGPRARVHTIGAAVSADGLHFDRIGAEEGIMVGRAPEVVYHNDVFYLFVELRPRDLGQPDPPPEVGWCEYYLFKSKDGVAFKRVADVPVIPLGPEGDWDSYNISTLRIVKEDGFFYMFYCASDRTNDWLQNVGVARSRDLMHWEKSPMNPIFGRCLDDWFGSCWYPTSLRAGNDVYFMYEYTGLPLAEPEAAYSKPRRTPKITKGLAVLSNAQFKEYFA